MPKRSLVVGAMTSMAFVMSLFAAQNPAPVPQSGAPEGYPAPSQPPIVTLLAQGAEPRVSMRYRISNKLKTVADLTMLVKMGAQMAGMPAQSVESPPLKMLMSIGVTDVSATGDVSYDFAITDVTLDSKSDVDPDLVTALQSAVTSMKLVRGKGVITNRGATKKMTQDAAIPDPQIQETLSHLVDSIQNMTPPFPEEPLGVGAQWEARHAVESNGLRMYQKAVYHVTAIDRDGASLDVAFGQTAPPQPLTAPGVTGALQSLVGSGTGHSKIRFDSPVPTSDATITTTMVIGAGAGTEAPRMTMEMTMTMTIAPKKQ